MEENKNLEQPMQETSQSSYVNNNILEGEDVLADGSILGKFQTVNDLKKAYNNLQAEFTKKSQKLSELLKRDNSSSEPENGLEKNSTMQTDKIVQTSHILEVDAKDGSTMQSTMQTNENLTGEPQHNLQNWKNEVAEFLVSNPAAKNFASEITSLLLSDKVLASSKNSLDLAYGKVLAKHYKTQEELMRDDNFLQNYVLNNSKLKQTIIGEYLNNIRQNKVPTVVSNHVGSYVGLTPQDKPKNLNEANKILEKMLKQK